MPVMTSRFDSKTSLQQDEATLRRAVPLQSNLSVSSLRTKMYRFLIVLIFAAFVNCADEKTECQQHRHREMNSRAPLPMRLIPECDENGDYKPFQCFKDSDFCVCWDKTGQPLSQPSKKIKACDCIVQRETVYKKKLIGAYAPQCEENGKYKKIQCHGSTGHCWCAEEHSGKNTTAPARGNVNC